MKITTAELRKEFLSILRENLIPAAQEGRTAALSLAAPPWRMAPEVKVMPLDLPPLQTTEKSRNYFIKTQWSEFGMTANRFPEFVYVFNGEIDMRIVGQVESGPKVHDQQEAVLLQGLTQGSMLLCPAGSPHDASRHWWRDEEAEEASSEIFWMTALPEGMRCHICSTRGAQHTYRGWLLAEDPQINGLTELLIHELRVQDKRQKMAVQSLLLFILLRVERALNTKGVPLTRQDFRLDDKPVDAERSTRSVTFERARDFIEDNLQDNLSVAAIALYTAVSATQLNRIFREVEGNSVMAYVTKCRMEAACLYLTHGNLAVAEIGRRVGHRNASQFSNAFLKYAGVSPQNYRKTRKISQK